MSGASSGSKTGATSMGWPGRAIGTLEPNTASFGIVCAHERPEQANTYVVLYVPTSEVISQHESMAEARAVVRRYESADVKPMETARGSSPCRDTWRCEHHDRNAASGTSRCGTRSRDRTDAGMMSASLFGKVDARFDLLPKQRRECFEMVCHSQTAWPEFYICSRFPGTF